MIVRGAAVLATCALLASCDGGRTSTGPPDEPATHCASAVLQVGNTSSCPPFATKESKELADNRIGAVAETRHIGEWAWSTGLKWMRVIVDPFGQWQHVDWETDEYAVGPEEERVIDDLVSNGVRIKLVLDVWHPESRTVYHKTEEDIQLYLSWVRFMVRHFKGRIEYYEILNEPDLSFEAPSGMPVDAYVNLVKRTVPVIREEDPQAKIVVGAVPDTRFDHVRDWMWGLLNSEIMPLVDGFSWHGMYGAAPSGDPRGVRQPETPQMENYWENYPALVGEIMRVAGSNGFEGEYLVDEMLWRTPSEPHETEPDGFTDVSGAKYYARAIIIHLGLNVTTGLGVVLHNSRHAVVRGLSTVMAGALPADLPVVIQSEATNVKHYGFALQSGEKLLAIWTDGPAVDHDPAIEATVTLPGVAPGRITGIDVLRGLEQELSGSPYDGGVTIHGLLVRDYPLILKFRNP
jgi:hypothetical protein